MTLQSNSQEKRRRIFIDEFKTYYAITHKSTWDIEKQPKLFVAITEQYLYCSERLPTEHIEPFLRGLGDKFLGKLEYNTAISHYLARENLNPPKEEEVKLTSQQKNFWSTVCRALALKDFAGNTIPIDIIRAVAVRRTYDHFDRELPDFWVKKLEAAKTEDVKGAEEYLQSLKKKQLTTN